MEKQTLPAEVRDARGKGPARQLRMKGKIPAVLYGPGGDTVALSVDPTALVKALTTPFRRNQLLELDLGANTQLATVKDLDVHPVSRAVRHADFYRVSLDKPAIYQVPLRTAGRAKGVVKGGELRVHFRTLPLRVTPDKVPAEILINVENLDMLESVKVKDIQLEAGEIQLPAERAVAFVTSEQKKIAEEDPAAPGAGAAPAAAPSKAPPAKK
jgi:large subunit ribosomal protein L25